MENWNVLIDSVLGDMIGAGGGAERGIENKS